jgi:transcription elongation factor/antiterminator RfaH
MLERHQHNLQPATNQPTQNSAWYVIHCQPHKEHYAAIALQEQLGLTIYLPEVIRSYQGQMQCAPLFPRYLFAQVDLHTVPPSRINAAPGVTRLVAFDTTPRTVPAAVVQAIHEQVQQLNKQGGLAEPGFQPGDTVQIKAGPLHGLEAVFLGPTTPRERVWILLEFMGRLNEVEINRESLQSIGSEQPAPKRPRRTRGKGRKIVGSPQMV